jgi:hypothetical protein
MLSNGLRVIVAFSLMAVLPGCTEINDSRELAAYDCGMTTNSTLQFQSHAWQVCKETALNQTFDLLGEELAALESTIALVQPSGTNDEVLAAWTNYEANRSRSMQKIVSLLHALEAGNATLAANQTWSGVFQAIQEGADRPVARYRNAFARNAEGNVSTVLRLRQQTSGSLAGGLFLGSILGLVPALVVMRRAQAKATYWGAFSQTEDVSKARNGLLRMALAFAGLGAVLVVGLFVVTGGYVIG